MCEEKCIKAAAVCLCTMENIFGGCPLTIDRDQMMQDFCKRTGAMMGAHSESKKHHHKKSKRCPFRDLSHRIIMMLRENPQVTTPDRHAELHRRMDRVLDELAALESQIPTMAKQLEGMRHRSTELGDVLSRLEQLDSTCSLARTANISSRQCRFANPLER